MTDEGARKYVIVIVFVCPPLSLLPVPATVLERFITETETEKQPESGIDDCGVATCAKVPQRGVTFVRMLCGGRINWRKMKGEKGI
jgi:hypothetical protein